MPHETRILKDGWERRAEFGDLSDPGNRRRVARWIAKRRKSRLERLGVERKEFVARLAAAPPTIGSVLGTGFILYAERHGKERWGDKRPSYAQNLDALFAMFPDAQFVNLVRDPRAVVASVRKIGWYGGDLVDGAGLWGRSVRAVDDWRARLAPDQLLDVQYEELVEDPRGSLELIASFLGLAQEGVDAMLLFHENAGVFRDMVWHPLVSTPVTTEAVRAWEDALTREEVAFVEDVLSADMRRFGYAPAAGDTSVPEDMLQRFRVHRRKRARKDMRRRIAERKLKLTYRQPVAARFESPGDRS